MTRHLHLRLNEFIRSFLGKVLLAESKACGKTRRHGVPDQGSRMVGNTAQLGGGGRVAHGQPLVTPFRSGLNKPQGAVKRSRTQCGDITGTQSACWQQARHVTLELAK